MTSNPCCTLSNRLVLSWWAIAIFVALSGCATMERVSREVGWLFSASRELREIMQQGGKYLQQGEYTLALDSFQQSKAMAEAEFSEVSAATAHGDGWHKDFLSVSN